MVNIRLTIFVEKCILDMYKFHKNGICILLRSYLSNEQIE